MDAEAERHRRVRELFHEAVELAGADRERFLAERAAGDPAVAAELRSLLLAHDDAGDFVSEGLAAHQREVDREVVASLVGQRLGAYRLERLLGRGGMGAVYLGRRADDAFQQDVAIKLLRPELATPDLVRRFRAERQTLANLHHPNIARLLDGGATEDGLPYLVMEHVAGVPLEEHCDEKRLSLEERLGLFLSVCSAVEEAHRNLVVHRDIKPANILVDREGVVKLLDFGIAKLLEPRAADETAPMTRALGYATLAFASPEQMLGGPVTTGTDVYALGVLLYRLVTGRHPYDLTDKSPTEVARLVCEVVPAAPSRVVADARAARALAGDLDQITLLALRKEPARRYGTVAELAEDVRRNLAGQPVSARADTVGYRVGKFVTRHRAGVAAAALGLVALVAGLAGYARQARIAREEARRAGVERAKQEQVSAFLSEALSSADPVKGAGRSVTVAEVLARASERLGRDLAGQPEVEASLRGTLGDTYLSLGLPTEAEREFRRMLKIAGPLRPIDLARLGAALSDGGRWNEAEKELKRAIALCHASGERSIPCAHALDLLMVTYQNLGRFDEAARAGREALELLRGGFPAERLELASVLNNLGIVLGNTGSFQEAERLHREAVEAARASRGERHPMTAEAIANLAGILDIQGRTAEAEPLFKQALALQEALIGERHFDFIRTLTSYANMLWLTKRSPEAEPLARRAQSLAVGALGQEHPLTAYAENILGCVLLDVGKPAEAEAHIRPALAARRKAFPAGHWLIASARSNLGAALAAQGKSAEAEKELLAAYADLAKDRGAKHEKSLLTAGRLAALYAKAGRMAEAKRYGELSTP